MPAANPDETGYLFAARVLGGGADADLSGATFYQIGYPLLISPAFWFSDDPGTVYHLVIGINSLISALIVPLAYVAGLRLALSRATAFWVAQAAALLPASIFFTQFVLTDAILPVVVLAWLLAIHSWLDRDARGEGAARYAVAASLSAAYAYATHSRGLVILIAHAALLGFVFAFRWASRRPTLIAGGVLLGAVAAAYAANLWLQGHTYPDGIKELGNWLSERLTSPDGWAWTISGGLGQIWYLTVATWGLGGVALAGAAVALRRAGRPERAVAGVTLLTVTGIAFVTIAALPDEHRVGNYVYGRYLACLAPALLVAGFALLARRRLVWASAGLLLGTALIAQIHAGTRLTRYIFVPFDFPETSFLTWDWHGFKLWPATAVALLILGATALLARRFTAGAVALLCAVGLGADIMATDRISDVMTEEMHVSARLDALRPDDKVAVEFDVPWKIRLPQTFAIPSELGRFTLAKGEQPPPGTTLVLTAWPRDVPADAAWPGRPSGWHPVEARRTTLGDWVAWRR
ncbi:hypothetical protein GCM10010468_13910 [Actinocorallia longicatena]|uniref:Glycosyltransferase RgtA/B/C/D-like domain-containing protein n=1 Tax=Actinocorallia longicatena TaxID=111803 RepID=A0ABP6Q2L9_9ACTN